MIGDWCEVISSFPRGRTRSGQGVPPVAFAGRVGRRKGFTLLELMVVIAMIGVLVALLLPAIQSSRESVRRVVCQNNLGQLLLGLRGYESAHDVLPSGVVHPSGPILSPSEGFHAGWMVQLLPYVEQGVLFDLYNTSVGVYEPANLTVRKAEVSLFLCPSQPIRTADVEQIMPSCYAGCHNDVEAPIDVSNHGCLYLNSSIRTREIPDGTTRTLLLGELIAEPASLGWASGTRATLRNTGHSLSDERRLWRNRAIDVTIGPDVVGGFSSWHTGGVNFGFADGSQRYIGDSIDQGLLRRLAHRDDKAPLTDSF